LVFPHFFSHDHQINITGYVKYYKLELASIILVYYMEKIAILTESWLIIKQLYVIHTGKKWEFSMQVSPTK
jgi:hypothetical protein